VRRSCSSPKYRRSPCCRQGKDGVCADGPSRPSRPQVCIASWPGAVCCYLRRTLRKGQWRKRPGHPVSRRPGRLSAARNAAAPLAFFGESVVGVSPRNLGVGTIGPETGLDERTRPGPGCDPGGGRGRRLRGPSTPRSRSCPGRRRMGRPSGARVVFGPPSTPAALT
jgi:hypothetical protein